MPAALPDPYERITWRIEATTLLLLRRYYGEKNVNAAVREILTDHCMTLRFTRPPQP